MIVIISADIDPHANLVADKLRSRGVSFVRFDHAAFPANAEISVRFSEHGPVEQILRLNGQCISLDQVTAIWHRRPYSPTAHESVKDKDNQEYIVEESTIFLRDLWNSLDCLKVPAAQPIYRRAELKASQLVTATQIGFKIPPTLITNSPKDFLEFYRNQNSRVINKLPSSIFMNNYFGDKFCRYTEIVSNRDIGYYRSIRHSPVIFQGYVDKKVELRVTVVGKRIFAAEIHSQTTNRTRHDWRRYDLGNTPHYPHQLPDAVERQCLELVEKLGLCYGAIDLILTPDGQYVFIEINPNGQYLWIEERTGLPISDAICDLLVSGASNKQPVNNGIITNELNGS